MRGDEAIELRMSVMKHFAAKEFHQAEGAVRRLIERTDAADALELSNLFGLLASTLDNLARHDEATEMFRRALLEAQRAGPPSNLAVDSARWMLANHYLVHGDPSLALAECEPLPRPKGHLQCHLQAVAAEALWKLARSQEAQNAAQRAVDLAPTDESRAELSRQLGYILAAG